MKTRRVWIAPIFIPHEGCPYRCVFCNPSDITGWRPQADAERVRKVLEDYLIPIRRAHRYARREVAFYGGSFTGLSDQRQEFLLSRVKPWIDSGRVDAIRVSTHPLFIDAPRLDRLQAHRVETVELGVQSTDPLVLERSGRPCSRFELNRAVAWVRQRGFKLGLQVMLGLPGDNEERCERSVADCIGWKPDFVRLYPALVLRHTRLHAMYRQGRYQPWTLERTLQALKEAVKSFDRSGIPVVRVGLQPDRALSENLVAGPFHPSMRYLVDCRIGLEKMVREIEHLDRLPSGILFKVPMKSVSIYTGNRRENIRKLKERFALKEVRLRGEERRRRIGTVAWYNQETLLMEGNCRNGYNRDEL